jgi:GNAT superfamily N-acetyltransferase
MIWLRDARQGDEALLLRFINELADYEKLTHEVKATPALLRDALFGPAPQAAALLAEIDGTAVGYAMWLHKFSSFAGRSALFLEDIYVDPAARGRGVGRAIFQHLAQRALADGCVRMEWVVLDWNAPSIAFYRGLGAKPVPGWTTYGLSGAALAAVAG